VDLHLTDIESLTTITVFARSLSAD